jgi:uncharacterized membrane protein YedE/YeeE
MYHEILGGLLIGLASAIPLLFDGRIAGVSGYASTAAQIKNAENRSSLMFVGGLLLGGLAWRLLGGTVPTFSADSENLFVYGIAGLLVGFGSRLGGGCTSGHGVCGLGRASRRSFVHVLVFMSVAILTVLLMRAVA